MYKFLTTGTIFVPGLLPKSLHISRGNSYLSSPERTCLLCKYLNINRRVQIRNQTSVTNPDINNPKTVRKKKSNKFTDVLVVTEKFQGLKRTNIVKLKKSNAVNFLTQADLSVNEQNKKSCDKQSKLLSSISVTPNDKILTKTEELNTESFTQYNSLVNNHPNLETYDINNQRIDVDSERFVDENGLDNITLNNPMQFSKDIESSLTVEDSTKTRSNKKKVKNSKLNLEEKFSGLITEKTLAAYIDVCNYLNLPSRGLAAFYFHQTFLSKKKCDSHFNPTVVRHIFQPLLKGFASQGKYPELKDIFTFIYSNNLQPDLQCFASLFVCLGRINDPTTNSHLGEIKHYVQEALKLNISLYDILNYGSFANNEREYVIKAFQSYDSNFQFTQQMPRIHYNNELVNHLNHPAQMSSDVEKNLSLPNDFNLLTLSDIQKKFDRQLEVERQGYLEVKSIQKSIKRSKDVEYYRRVLDELFTQWRKDAEQALIRDINALSARKSALNMEIYIKSVPLKDLVNIIVEEAKTLSQGSETFSPDAMLLYRILGDRVYARYLILLKKKIGALDKILGIQRKYCESYARQHGKLKSLPETQELINSRALWQWIGHNEFKDGGSINTNHQPWVPRLLRNIGRFLYHIIIHDLKINTSCLNKNGKKENFLPAFYTIFRQKTFVCEEIKPHPVLSKLYRLSECETLVFPTIEAPMYCPPVPWTSIDSGGYLITSTELVRLPNHASTQKTRLIDTDPVHLYPNFDALNQLSSVPWRINKRLLDTIIEVFQNGGSSKLDVPEHPSSLKPPPPVTPIMDKATKSQTIRLHLQHKRRRGEMYSLWCDCLYRLSLANHYRDDIFWFPHNMDFRGRVYPLPPHLTHLGPDLARSMLIFAEGRPLGPDGFNWLKIHLINLTGLKKREPLANRLAFANENMDLILDSAQNPLDGKRWWAQSDEPWQTLAVCVEIDNVLKSGVNPEDYICHFPVHQDGSCNGLQHYAALGRDAAGAFSVNLTATENPQDIYSTVVALVEEQRARDEENGNEIAIALKGFVKRQVIKQTIMTTVYGVTRYGAKLQIAKQLKDIEDFPLRLVPTASSYLTKRTFESLRTMFTSTREIQDWFTNCARLISGPIGSNVEWISPLGLPIVQPYTNSKLVTGYDSVLIDDYEHPNVMKQKNAFPPNFIHSLDSTHMMLTALNCERAGITFASVHDCYWTHPSTVHIMNKICREQFVALHSQPILENLSSFLYQKYNVITDLKLMKQCLLFKRVPQTGNFDINNVLKSVYFFS